MRDQMRRIREEPLDLYGGACSLGLETSRSRKSSKSGTMLGIASATSTRGAVWRTILAGATTSVRTTVRQQGWDMLAPLQSPAISLQQSMSGGISGWSGIKHTTWGPNPQPSTTPKTNARKAHGMCQVYMTVSRTQRFRILRFTVSRFLNGGHW